MLGADYSKDHVPNNRRRSGSRDRVRRDSSENVSYNGGMDEDVSNLSRQRAQSGHNEHSLIGNTN